MTTTATEARPIPRRAAARRTIDALTIGVRSLVGVLLRRPAVPTGASAHPHSKAMRPVLLAILGISLVEVPIVDLVVHPWPWLRWPLLVAGVWGVLSMLGMLLAMHRNPHAVGPAGIRLRSGELVDVALPWDDVAMVERRRHAMPGAPTLSLVGEGDEVALAHVAQDGTDVDVVLERPTPIDLPGGTVTVSRVRLSVDDVGAFLDAVRTHIP